MRDTLPKADLSLREGGNARGVWLKMGYGRGAERGELRAGSDSGEFHGRGAKRGKAVEGYGWGAERGKVGRGARGEGARAM